MVGHLERAIEKLKKQVLVLSDIVENSVWEAVEALANGDEEMAKRVIARDFEVDELEVEVEEECQKILALYQPVAADLRLIISVLKINRDLERVGDFAVSIADKVSTLAHFPLRTSIIDFRNMADKSLKMLRLAIDSLVHWDSELARMVISADDEVDEIKRSNTAKIKERLQVRPDETGALLDILSVSRHLERIADHATNIAEDVLYLIEGEIVRHKLTGPAP